VFRKEVKEAGDDHIDQDSPRRDAYRACNFYPVRDVRRPGRRFQADPAYGHPVKEQSDDNPDAGPKDAVRSLPQFGKEAWFI